MLESLPNIKPWSSRQSLLYQLNAFFYFKMDTEAFVELLTGLMHEEVVLRDALVDVLCLPRR